MDDLMMLADGTFVSLKWAEPWKSPIDDNPVEKPTHLWRYPGGFRLGRRQEPVRVLAPAPKRAAPSRGAHP